MCGAAAPRPEGEVFARCANVSCPARLKESVLHFAQREAMDIEGLGEALVEQLVDRGMLRDLADVYALEAGALAGLERMGKKSARNLVERIARSTAAPLERLVYGLGIRFVGARTAQLLCDAFPTMEALRAAGRDELTRVHEVGDKVADAIRQFFEQEQNLRLIDRLAAAGLSMRASERRPHAAGPFTGKACVVTGAIPGYTRDDIRKIIRAQGGRVAEAVSKKTDLLICGEESGAKLARARSLGVRIIDAAAFRALVEGRDGGASTDA